MFFDKKAIAFRLGKDVKDVRIGLTASTFDLFHAGHTVMLMESKSLCDYLVVGLLVDPTKDRLGIKNKPVQSVLERYLQVAACRYVDEVIPFETEQDLVDMILTINPDIRICGEEYKDKDHTGKGLCPIHYNLRRHSFSTTELRQRVALCTPIPDFKNSTIDSPAQAR
jgi:glycerol-3-phosphate cytidylyltransferase